VAKQERDPDHARDEYLEHSTLNRAQQLAR
jgi:hypothetical protein